MAWRRLGNMTPLLAFSCFCLLVGDMLFGYDTGSFGGILANPGFINQFGIANAKGVYAISSLHTSLLSSLAFIGKFAGCVLAGPLIERWGHRAVFLILAAVSYVGIVVEMTSAGTGDGTGRLAQFIVGRIVVYASVGLVEVTVTDPSQLTFAITSKVVLELTVIRTYQSEIVPAPLRGLVVLSLQLFLNAGSLVATGVNRAFSTYTSSVGWRVATGIQFAFPTLILGFLPFIPDSPRWLLSKDREADAVHALRRLRTPEEVSLGHCEAELSAIHEALRANVHKASWSAVFRGSNLRRTLVVLVGFTYQQITGQAFVSTYQTVFYKSNGYAAQAFTFPVINGVLGTLAVIPGMFLVDSLGRRPLFMISCALQAFWMFLLAGLGSKPYKTTTESNTVVAAFMLYSVCYSLGGAATPYLLAAEVPNNAVREKTASLGAALNVVWAFITNFVLPYMLAALSFKVGYIFGGIALSAVVWTFFFLPETKGRALEEIDAVFEKPFNPFRPTVVTPSSAARRVGELEDDGKQEHQHVHEADEKAVENQAV
ncbi:hypothetical protein EHS25_008899 [Saitozyma podzolica]|uniref:Major facilitator superfamily (MFS) profile domain-containing protein n=1 Tax=Saitozyma podzolica TaxID=1890683 RepID=A0A427YN24_9TREE|nr:hypothetical protein EHS25_008899 [Saitozyma podzolica]